MKPCGKSTKETVDYEIIVIDGLQATL